jgi:N-formylglutamate deformylase
MKPDVYRLHRGVLPLLISLPHDGSALPADIEPGLVPEARRVPDTDWHVSRLYGFALELGASVLVPSYSRYVVDLNRSDDDRSLYPGQNTTGLCPVRRFDGGAVYVDGAEPSTQEIATRVERYWQPYHRALAAELQRLRSRFDRVLLWEGHSIRGELPWLFEGRLPDLNLGTAAGHSCSDAVARALAAQLDTQRDYDWVVDGRFKGGYITRHYGQPDLGVEAVQLELSQRTYMDEDSFEYLPARAELLQRCLQRLLHAALRAIGSPAEGVTVSG